jgi:OTU domain-containing protein 3
LLPYQYQILLPSQEAPRAPVKKIRRKRLQAPTSAMAKRKTAIGGGLMGLAMGDGNAKQAKKISSKKKKKQPPFVSKGKASKGAASLEQQLKQLNCRIVQMAADGNCLFRSLSDQFYGSAAQYKKVRSDVVQFMKKRNDTFAPFMEDDIDFNTYCMLMAEDKKWGGQQEIIAASSLFACNVVIHSFNSPMLELKIDEKTQKRKPYKGSVRTLHLCYRRGNHYDSVRAAGDRGGSGKPPQRIILRERINKQEQQHWWWDYNNAMAALGR